MRGTEARQVLVQRRDTQRFHCFPATRFSFKEPVTAAGQAQSGGVPTMPSDATNEATRQEWRSLGFFYELDGPAKVRRLGAARAGTLRSPHPILKDGAHPSKAEDTDH